MPKRQWWMTGVEKLAKWCWDDSNQIRPIKELAVDVGWASTTATGVLSEVQYLSREVNLANSSYANLEGSAVHVVASMLAAEVERLAVMTADSMGPWVDEGIVVSLVGRMSGHISELLSYVALAERGEFVVRFRPFEEMVPFDPDRVEHGEEK